MHKEKLQVSAAQIPFFDTTTRIYIFQRLDPEKVILIKKLNLKTGTSLFFLTDSNY
ncbi:hypothetical protein FLACOL7796_03554 [Flavobacterium collinsii]|jgi:hypothetical protein|uniref:Uncharacterized protein n=1 Tax=Flavobacterium collinsii TaxID=1114861 RepID=A0ABN7EPI6_9FLAO|nr:hypothetical protein FLACOL7796_03554 [Flavobacterium collinsii]